MARRALRDRALPHRGFAQLAARDDRIEAAAPHPPAAERTDRRPRTAAHPARAHTRDDPLPHEHGLLRARYTLLAWLAAWYGTHIAGFYDWALRTGWALSIEHALLILGGLLFWWPLVSGRLSPPPALAYLGAGFVASAFLGLALIFSSRPFYSFYEHAPRLWGLSPIRGTSAES